MTHDELYQGLREAVEHYWGTRARQKGRQGAKTGRKDQGNRADATGGKQLDGFVALCRTILADAGLMDNEVYTSKKDTVIPGFFRPAKAWDVVAVSSGRLVATIEVKSHAGPSFSNNFNNRVEEAIGNAADFWTAYREGAYPARIKPFLGYILLLEEADDSTRKLKNESFHFSVLSEFEGASYAKRYEIFCDKLVREGLYDSAAFVMSDRAKGLAGGFLEPASKLSIATFAAALKGKAVAFLEEQRLA